MYLARVTRVAIIAPLRGLPVQGQAVWNKLDSEAFLSCAFNPGSSVIGPAGILMSKLCIDGSHLAPLAFLLLFLHHIHTYMQLHTWLLISVNYIVNMFVTAWTSSTVHDSFKRSKLSVLILICSGHNRIYYKIANSRKNVVKFFYRGSLAQKFSTWKLYTITFDLKNHKLQCLYKTTIVQAYDVHVIHRRLGLFFMYANFHDWKVSHENHEIMMCMGDKNGQVEKEALLNTC